MNNFTGQLSISIVSFGIIMNSSVIDESKGHTIYAELPKSQIKSGAEYLEFYTLPIIIGKQSIQGFSVELVITQIERGIDRLEGLKVDVHFLFLTFVSNDRSTVNHESFWGH